jgi:hypothetical protein
MQNDEPRAGRMPLAEAVERAKGALFDDLPKDEIIRSYLYAGGDEIRRDRFSSPRSSAVLAANTFGYFVGGPERAARLVWPAGLTVPGPASRVRMEAEMAFPWRGGKRPWLDARVDAGDWLIGVEAKRFEPFSDHHKVEFRPPYFETDWGLAMKPFADRRDGLSNGQETFNLLDAAQLVKHAFGLRTQAQRDKRRPMLVYLYAEPKVDWRRKPVSMEVIKRHRDDVTRFAAAVAGAEVEFRSLSYDELLSAWSDSGDADLAAHARRIADRFDP